MNRETDLLRLINYTEHGDPINGARVDFFLFNEIKCEMTLPVKHGDHLYGKLENYLENKFRKFLTRNYKEPVIPDYTNRRTLVTIGGNKPTFEPLPLSAIEKVEFLDKTIYKYTKGSDIHQEARKKLIELIKGL